MSQNPPDREHVNGAAKELGAILDSLKVPYALMGGSACSALGSVRATNDIDLCITPVKIDGKEYDSYDLQNYLIKNYPDKIVGVDEEGVGVLIPQIKYQGAKLTVDIFDSHTWRDRPQYDLSKSTRTKADGISIFSPSWLLREKIATLADRNMNPPKKISDRFDITFLMDRVPKDQYHKAELNLATSQYHRDKFNTVMKDADLLRQEVKDRLKVMFTGY